jgi:hypothetical protein
MGPQTWEISQGTQSEVIGDANHGVCVETHIKQILGPDWADCSRKQGWEVRTCANSQESRACATVDIRSTPAHKQAPNTRVLRDAADRDGKLVISRIIRLMPNQEQFLKMYHYPAQNGIPDITWVQTGELTQGQGRRY